MNNNKTFNYRNMSISINIDANTDCEKLNNEIDNLLDNIGKKYNSDYNTKICIKNKNNMVVYASLNTTNLSMRELKIHKEFCFIKEDFKCEYYINSITKAEISSNIIKSLLNKKDIIGVPKLLFVQQF